MRRLDELREVIIQNQDSFILLSSENNIYYFTGFKPTTVAYLVYADGVFRLFVTNIDYQKASEAAKGVEVVKPDIKVKVEDAVNAFVKGLKGRMFFEYSQLTYDEFLEVFNGASGLVFENLDEIILRFRSVKSAEEVNLIKRAIMITENAIRKVHNMLSNGVNEMEMAATIEYEMRRSGADGLAFETILLSGEKTALPHAISEDRRIRDGELVLIDVGCRFKGYCSDMTRTFIVGEPTKKQKEVYDIVKTGQEMAISKIKDGVPVDTLDLTAREYFRSVGYGEYFIHSLGHGVGLDVHEYPTVSFRYKVPVREGMVITVEPGLYIPGWGGIRIEDMVLVKKSGCQVLTSLPKSLTEV